MDQVVEKSHANIAAAILAGGKARRFGGIAKGNLKIASDLTIIQHLLVELKAAEISERIIVANDDQAYRNYGVPIIHDQYHDVGPIAGIISALHYCYHHFHAVLFLPCDLPLLTVSEIRGLINAYVQNSASVVFARTKDYGHPLCAVVPTQNLFAIQSEVDRGTRPIREIWKKLGAQAILFANQQAFVNINCAEDMN